MQQSENDFLDSFGRYKYLRLPFRINLAPKEFECNLHEKPDGLPGVPIIIDNILVMDYFTKMNKRTWNNP